MRNSMISFVQMMKILTWITIRMKKKIERSTLMSNLSHLIHGKISKTGISLLSMENKLNAWLLVLDGVLQLPISGIFEFFL